MFIFQLCITHLSNRFWYSSIAYIIPYITPEMFGLVTFLSAKLISIKTRFKLKQKIYPCYLYYAVIFYLLLDILIKNKTVPH